MVQLSKTGLRENPSLKAGHPPAVKAGGKRLAKKTSEESVTHEKETRRLAEKPRSLAALPRMQSVSILLAGTLDKLRRQFPSTPASVRHGRLGPAMEKPHSPRIFSIQQPRKC